MARFGARAFGIPTTIARLSVPYGDDFGWPRFHLAMMQSGHAVPVHVDAPSEYNPIHVDDIVAQIPALLDAASAPATIVNWAGDDVVSIEDWCALLADRTGLEVKFAPTDHTIKSVACDTTKRASITGPCRVAWRDGMSRLAATVGA
jgi:nucleoside-diphosphate-sugar epimerase